MIKVLACCDWSVDTDAVLVSEISCGNRAVDLSNHVLDSSLVVSSINHRKMANSELYKVVNDHVSLCKYRTNYYTDRSDDRLNGRPAGQIVSDEGGVPNDPNPN